MAQGFYGVPHGFIEVTRVSLSKNDPEVTLLVNVDHLASVVDSPGMGDSEAGGCWLNVTAYTGYYGVHVKESYHDVKMSIHLTRRRTER